MRRLSLIWLALPLCGAGLEDDARGILARRCLTCHSRQTKTANLDLSAREGVLRVKDLLVTRVVGGQMPPGKPLPAEERETLRQWIEAGAPWKTGWWSLQPVRVRETPAIAKQSPIDRWVIAKLREQGLQASPLADRRTLIRRATFDLTGLPPAPEDIAAFLADTSSDAYERLVDRLLASPRYGEQWARHWLDVVRYSESEGFERDTLREHAWPFRDYVIRSFNDDKPYWQFIREQIAGDVLEPATHDGLIATGLLVLGPIDAVGLTSAVADERERTREDHLEELTGVVAQTFLGLTVNCARCHDHKFDPIPQRDFYRMKSVFAGVWPPSEGAEFQASSRPLLTAAERAAREAEVSRLKAGVTAAEAELGAFDRRGRPSREIAGVPRPVAHWSFDADARDDIGQLHPFVPADVPTPVDRLLPPPGKESVRLTTAPLNFDLREKTLEAWIRVAKAPDKGTNILLIRNRSGFRGAAVDAIHYAGGKTKQWDNASTVAFRTEDVNGEPEDTPVGGRVHMAIAYDASGDIRMYRNGRLYGKAYRPDPGSQHGRLQTYGKDDALVELTSANGFELEEARIYGAALTAEQIAASHAAGVAHHPPIPSDERTRLAQALTDARVELKALAEPAQIFAAETRAPGVTHLLARGDVSRKTDIVGPGALSCLPGDFELAPDASDAERRRRLAAWIADPAHPLTARVLVNRVWHYHFGSGLVDSPNDFGFNGGEPSHPEMLDWLASEFVRSGGSLKRLHRTIMTSETYRQSSRFDSAAAAKDGGARFLWRFPPQRLPGEAVRDAMLASSGLLNGSMFGASFRPFEIRKNSGSYHSYEAIDSAAPEFQRRTVYRMNVNSGGNPMLDALDCPLPSVKTPKRSSTTTALQALSLMNNPFVDRMAKALAARLTAEGAADPVSRAYALTLGRPPRPEEAESAVKLIAQAGLPAFCWALFNMSEFLYVE